MLALPRQKLERTEMIKPPANIAEPICKWILVRRQLSTHCNHRASRIFSPAKYYSPLAWPWQTLVRSNSGLFSRTYPETDYFPNFLSG